MARKKATAEKPRLGVPDALEAALEEARHAKEGALKLQRAIEALRTGLETIVVAEFDRVKNLPVSAADLRGLAINALDEYARLTGQSWRRNKLQGSWAGGTGNAPVHERDI